MLRAAGGKGLARPKDLDRPLITLERATVLRLRFKGRDKGGATAFTYLIFALRKKGAVDLIESLAGFFEASASRLRLSSES